MSIGSRPGGGDAPGMDSERDAHLREALRHAPDAGIGAPAALSHAILRQAREALATPSITSEGPQTQRTASPPRAAASSGRTRASPPPSVLSTLWAWLMRPSVATGFASVMVATLVGVMWWGQPIDDPVTEARAPAVGGPIAEAEPPASAPLREGGSGLAQPASSLSTPTLSAATNDAMKRDAQRVTGAPTSPPAARVPPKAAEAAADSARPPMAEVKRAPATEPTTSAPEAAMPARLERPATASVAPPPMPAAPQALESAQLGKAAALPNAAPPGADLPGVALPGAVPPGEAPTGGAPDRMAEAAADTNSPAADARARQGLRTAVAPGFSSNRVDSPVSRVRGAIAAWPDVWTWQRGSGPEQPMNDALRAWLASVDSATGANWQAAAGTAGSGSAPVLRLLRNGQLHTTVRILPDGVWVDAPPGSVPATSTARAAPSGTLAPLSPTRAAALRAALDQAAP